MNLPQRIIATVAIPDAAWLITTGIVRATSAYSKSAPYDRWWWLWLIVLFVVVAAEWWLWSPQQLDKPGRGS